MTAAHAISLPVGAFSQWQRRYALLRIPTFPVDMSLTPDGKPAKKPMVTRYATVGLPASAALAIKRSAANGIGFTADRARVTVLDVDTTDPSVLAQLQDRFGESRLVVQTATGKYHAYYQNDGEDRRIRPDPTLPFDILGAGLVIAPGSVCDIGEYRIIKGELEDLGRLTPMNERAAPYRSAGQPQPANENSRRLRAGQGRNDALFNYSMEQASYCDDVTALYDVARSYADREFEDLMTDAEVLRVATSAWGYESHGTNWKGRKEKVVAFDSAHMRSLIEADPDAWVLFSLLKDLYSGTTKPFIIANGLARQPWAGNLSLRRLQKARKVLLDKGYIKLVRRESTFHGPALFRFGV
jgi:hypothetical protein